MKKILLMMAIATTVKSGMAQTIVNDSVQLTAGYANQVWYSLDNDEQGSAPKNNWDIAFDVKGITSSVWINSVAGVTLWSYPKSDISGWGSIDTTGLSLLPKRYNSDTSWALGAMGNYADPSDATDLDWGKYDMSTHIVTGDSLYIIKLQNGDYKKLAIVSLSSGTFTFKYANLDGTGEQTATIIKTNFTGKNFAYYSLQNDAALAATREPDAADWDLVFTQYTTFIPQAYNVTGVLHNRGVRSVKVGNLADKNTYTDWSSQTFQSAINTIGYDWKSYNGSSYVVKDSTLYFVKTNNGDIWKLIFTGFASADGKFVFSKQKLQSTGIAGLDKASASMAVYPNPAAANGNITIVYNLETAIGAAAIHVYTMTGAAIYTSTIDKDPGIHHLTLPQLPQAGSYIIAIETDKGSLYQHLIIQ